MDEQTAAQFDWHKENHADSFLSWLVPTLLGELPKKTCEEIDTATKGFTDCRITVQINGIEVDAASFIEGVQMNMRIGVAREAERIVRQGTTLGEMEKLFARARRTVEADLIDQLRAAGLPILEDEEDSW